MKTLMLYLLGNKVGMSRWCLLMISQHAQCERGKVMGVDVHNYYMYVYLYIRYVDKKNWIVFYSD